MDLEALNTRIERYLAKKMSAEEQTAFEQEVNEHPEIKEEVLAQVLTNEAIHLMVEDDVRAKMDAIRNQSHDTIPNSPIIPIWKRRSFQIAVAACLIGIIIVGYFLLPFSTNGKQLDQLAFQRKLTEDLPVMMSAQTLRSGGGADILWQDCIDDFAKENYAEALACFQSEDFSDLQIQWFIAHCHLGLKQMDQAKTQFEQLLQQANPPIGSDDRTLLEYNWMLTLAWFEDDRLMPKLDSVLSIPSYKYYNKAQELKQLLESRN